MNFNEFTKNIHTLTPKPREVLRLLLEGKTDDEIAEAIEASTATVRKHVQNLCDRFEIEGEIDGQKRNRRDALVALVARHKHKLVSGRVPVPLDDAVVAETAEPDEASILLFGNSNAAGHQKEDWGEAPDVSSGFYDRMKELATLEKWIVQDGCRLVALLGIGGIGKTTLAAKLAEQLRDRFEYVTWRSLSNASPSQAIFTRQGIYLPEKDADERVSQLISHLRQHRCLLILDNAETILRSGELTGHYEERYKGYGELLRRVGLERHQSCLVLISREKPKEIAALEGETLPVRSLQLDGLGEAAREIFKAKGLVEEEREILIDLYGGNPLALNIVSTMIRELFNGRVSEFIRQGTLVFGDISDLLAQPFNRLSDLEKEILYWLAIERKPVSLPTLQADILLPIFQGELLEALVSLGRRSLIETSTKGSETLFTLQPVVMEYVTSKFIEQVSRDIYELLKNQKIEDTKLFRSHAIVKAQAQDGDVKETQEQLILTPILNRVRTLVRSDSIIKDRLETLKEKLNLDESHSRQTEKASLEVGYVSANVFHLHKEAAKLGVATKTYS